ncbi:hypothetical protein BDQ17DRAFT_1342074 [Cyathus striatus]|nr:hypothetical protein BDQ17DRAFT_1342074 [Cyathus striatus]
MASTTDTAPPSSAPAPPVIANRPLKPSEIPSDEIILAEAENILKSASTWKAGKKFYDQVQTYSKPKGPGDDAPWHLRVSEHPADEVTFDQMWEKLGKDKANNEKEYIHQIKKVTKVKELSPTATIWTMYYTFMPPISPRVFTELQVCILSESSPRVGTIISLPVDLSEDEELAKLEEQGVHGRYASVERITELENGSTEWRLAVTSTPGGSIPSFLAESSMSKTIAQDVPSFLNWYKGLPKA